MVCLCATSTQDQNHTSYHWNSTEYPGLLPRLFLSNLMLDLCQLVYKLKINYILMPIF